MILPLDNEHGKPVDWWFAYKLPIDVGPRKDSTGYEFLYTDAHKGENVELSPLDLHHENSAMGHTLKQVFSNSSDAGYVLWNDEIPPTKKGPKPRNKGTRGHSKGILGFSRKKGKGFYLLHSTPRFPSTDELKLPEDERKYGQTYLCVSLPDYKTVNQISAILHAQHQVQVYASQLPEVKKGDALWSLAYDEKVDRPEEPAVYDFKTYKGIPIRLIAKNKYWSRETDDYPNGKDFWEDLVVPTLDCDMTVETWRRGLVFEDEDKQEKEYTKDVLSMDLSSIGMKGYSWPFTKDHAKWGVSVERKRGLVVVADINRQVSQRRRGGGGLAFQSPEIWKALRNMEKAEKQIERNIHND